MALGRALDELALHRRHGGHHVHPPSIEVDAMRPQRRRLTPAQSGGRQEPAFRKADPSDFETVERPRLEATAWLASKGLDQWQPNAVRHPTPEGTRDAIERGVCFLAYEAAGPLGTITIDDRADPEFWTPDERRERALYVHRMIVARSAAGRDLGSAMLRWAENIARRGSYHWLRLDAWKSNPALHEYCGRHQFNYVRTVDRPRCGSGALYRRALGAAIRHGTGIERAGSEQPHGTA
jgi:GNAT superfamily N-acetyltransferase